MNQPTPNKLEFRLTKSYFAYLFIIALFVLVGAIYLLYDHQFMLGLLALLLFAIMVWGTIRQFKDNKPVITLTPKGILLEGKYFYSWRKIDTKIDAEPGKFKKNPRPHLYIISKWDSKTIKSVDIFGISPSSKTLENHINRYRNMLP